MKKNNADMSNPQQVISFKTCLALKHVFANNYSYTVFEKSVKVYNGIIVLSVAPPAQHYRLVVCVHFTDLNILWF